MEIRRPLFNNSIKVRVLLSQRLLSEVLVEEIPVVLFRLQFFFTFLIIKLAVIRGVEVDVVEARVLLVRWHGCIRRFHSSSLLLLLLLVLRQVEDVGLLVLVGFGREQAVGLLDGSIFSISSS